MIVVALQSLLAQLLHLHGDMAEKFLLKGCHQFGSPGRLLCDRKNAHYGNYS